MSWRLDRPRTALGGWVYRVIMKLSHRYNWHYAPPEYVEGGVYYWCQWCGIRHTENPRSAAIRALEVEV